MTLWTVAHQAPPSIESRQEYWSRLPFPTPGELPHPGIEPVSPLSPALTGGFFTIVLPGKLGYLLPTTNLGSAQLDEAEIYCRTKHVLDMCDE